MPKLRAVVSLLFLTALISMPALAARQGRLIGKVVDSSKKPVEGVMVTVTSPDIPSFKQVKTTDKKGTFTVDFDQINVNYLYRFEKTGHQTTETRQLWIKSGTEFFDFTLPVAEVVVEATPTAPAASSSVPAVNAYNSGIVALKAKDNATAEAKFQEAVKHDPNLRQAWSALSTVQLSLGRNEAAAASAEKAIALGAQDEAMLSARWQAYRNLKDTVKTAEALKDLERIGRRTEEAKKVHNEAVAFVKAGDHTSAFARFQEALNVDPNLQVSLLGLATAGVKIGKNAEAITAAEKILEDDPENEAAVRVRYNAALALGDKTKLIDALLGLAKFEPVIARDGLLKLAFEAYDANDNVVTRDRFKKALQIDPSYPQAYYYLGVIDASEGKSADARRNLEKFLQLAPKDPQSDSAREMLQYLKK